MKYQSVHPPKKLQGILWSSDVSKLDTDKDKTYIIHQIFAHGTMSEWKWLFKVYSPEEIKATFLNEPYKDYRAPRFNFVTNYLLDINSDSLNTYKYVKNIPRDTRRPA